MNKPDLNPLNPERISDSAQFEGQEEAKKKQLEIIQEHNPAPNDYSTWVRTVDDILTAREAFASEAENGVYPDFNKEDMENALSSGEVTVYSSHPIAEGAFVTPSRMKASDYVGVGGKIYAKTVKLTDVAWIDESEGQYAPAPGHKEEHNEIASIKEKAQANGTFMKAPNGKPSNLNERHWLQVRTTAFKNWFGDWEGEDNVSKIVDANGEPLPVSHSTNAEFTVFKNTQENDSGWLGAGHYFFGDRSLDGQYGKNVMETFLNVRNPYYASDEDINKLSELNDNAASKSFAMEVQAKGYDGVYYNGNLNQEIVVFNPNQIKSTMNNGNYSNESNDIRFLFVGEQGAANLDMAEEATTRLDNLNVARQMEASGKEAKNVKLATGWERGADGKWRYETPDLDIKEDNLNKLGTGDITALPLEDAIKNNGLFDAYPQLKSIMVRTRDGASIAMTAWNDVRKDIVFNNGYLHSISEAETRSTLIHEIQHAIQGIEGFTAGSNPNMFTDVIDEVAVEKARKRFHSILDNKTKENFFFEVEETRKKAAERREKVDALNREMDGLDLEDDKVYSDSEWLFKAKAEAEELYHNALESSQFLENALRQKIGDEGYREAHSAYFKWAVNPPQISFLAQYERSAGEVEARNASRRMNMTAEERRVSLAVETEDVARQDQLFLFDALSDKNFTPITRQEADALVDLLKKSGLAKEIVLGQEELRLIVEEDERQQAEALLTGKARLLAVGERITLGDSEYLKLGDGHFAKILRAKDGGEKQRPVAASGALKFVNEERRRLEEAAAREKDRLEDAFVASSSRYKSREKYNIIYRAALSEYISQTHSDVLREVYKKLCELGRERQGLIEQINDYKKKKREHEHGKRELNEKDVVERLRDVDLRITHAERNIEHYVPASVAAPVVTTADYFCDTETTFTPVMQLVYRMERDEHGNRIIKSNEQEIQSRWDAMKADDRFLHEKSPKSNSEYLIDKVNGDIYRFSDHWGFVASCTWAVNFDFTTSEDQAQGILRVSDGIAVSNVKNFVRKKDSYGWSNPEYCETMRSLLLEKLDIIKELVSNENSQTYLDKSAIKYLERSVIGRLFHDLKTKTLLQSEEHRDIINKYNALDKVTQDRQAFYMRARSGKVYGAVKDGVVYLDDTRLNANTPIHEFAHLWNDVVKKDNPTLWNKIVEQVKETAYFKELDNNPAYAHLSGEARADEAFARAVGDEGARVFHDPALGNTFKERFRQLLKDFWRCVGDKLGIRDLSPEQIGRLSFRQLVKGAAADITSKIPIKIGNCILTAEQREKLRRGESIQLASMVDKLGNRHANVQVRLKNNKIKVVKPELRPTLKLMKKKSAVRHM